MITIEDQINAVKEVTKDDPKMQKHMLKILEIERKYPNDKEKRLSLISKLIEQEVDNNNEQL